MDDNKSIELFGKPTNIIGKSSSELLLKCNGKIKILWGNKFIDLIDKSGKINCEKEKIIFTVDSEDEITKNGIYLLNDDIIINIDNNKRKISDSFIPGMIIMYNGSEIPEGWVICDGTNNTPDLTNSFIIKSINSERQELNLSDLALYYIMKN